MSRPKVFESEYRFCLILWEHEPVGSGELVRLCGEQLGWKPTTVYTVIKRLSARGILKNENAVVTSLVSRDDIQAAEIDELVEKKFDGSLPAFVAAFTKHRKLSEKEIDAVQQMIDRYRVLNRDDNTGDAKDKKEKHMDSEGGHR
ncbi:MAG: BlaI/MecI/CopY family transcriptional regulator [Lachnospiraceae bacterium]|nr:BlaI/MecI/CopY family transcriptional regulator [Lachnospiraceae bacterium]